jgi:hypothetical protein
MKLFKQIALSAFFTLGIFFAILYTSCSKDGCKGVTCLNYATCSGGTCNCKSGIGGTNCEIIFRNLYAGAYEGVTNASGKLDTVRSIDSNSLKNLLVFNAGNDTTNYNKMNLDWNDSSGRSIVNMSIILKNNSSIGSNFTVTPFSKDSFSYSGSGSVSNVSASLSLTRTHPHGSSTIIFSFNNFNRQ